MSDAPENSTQNNATNATEKSNVVEMPHSSAEDSTLVEDSNPEDSTFETPRPETAESGGTSKLTLLLGALLLVSLALHFVQAQARASLEAQSAEYSTALDRTIVRLDEETLRADGAQAKIEAIDSSVGNVNARIDELREALTELSEITAR